MKCKVCGNELNNNLCNRCGYEEYVWKGHFLKALFKSNNDNIVFSKEIENIISYLKKCFELKNSSHYISKKDIKDMLEMEKENINFIEKEIASGDITNYCSRFHFNQNNIELYLKRYKNMYEYIEEINQNFIKVNLSEKKEYFDNLLKKCDDKILLDDEQRIAILTDEDYNLVVAGAGTGKTTTVAGKVKYLVDMGYCNPQEILVISFTNKAVKELRERICNHLEVHCTVATFHSVGRAVLNAGNSIMYNKVCPDNFWPINDYLVQIVKTDQELLKKLIILFGYYLDVPEDMLENINMEEFFDLKDRKDYSTLKGNLNEVVHTFVDSRSKKRITLNNENVRSMQEVQIANFLYLNNIEYEYEKPYKYKIPNARKLYTPDFFIKQNDKECYIEHFGVSEDGKNNRYTAEELDHYQNEMEYKKFHHQKFGTSLICTYSNYNDGLELLKHLELELVKKGFVLNPKSDKEVYDRILNLEKNKYVTRFSNLASRFIHNFKTKGLTEEDFITLKLKTKNPRNLLFLDIIERVYLYYQSYLKENEAVDFEDMINESAKILDNIEKKGNKLPYKYIIIDEYQDISRQRFNLVKALNKVCDTKIMVVGDDWQSIYAFSGAEISLFTKFKEEMGYASILNITKTYRNSQELIDIAGDFIQKNTSQIQKKLKSDKKIQKPIVVCTYSDDYDKNKKKGFAGVDLEKATKLVEVIEKIIKVDGENTDLLIIGRYGFDLKHLIDTNLFAIKLHGKEEKVYCTKYPKFLMTFMTAHSSKGLTYDNVIIINAMNSVYGFPSQIEDDPILKFVINTDSTYEFAEERRLFYVAMTRTRNRVFILAPKLRPSKFVLELLNDYDNVVLYKSNDNVDEISFELTQVRKNRKYCPKCGYPLQLQYNKAYGLKLYICSNEPEICDFMTNDIRGNGNVHLCDKCNGYMIVKETKKTNKFFFGCTNYKKDGTGCNNTEELTIE